MGYYALKIQSDPDTASLMPRENKRIHRLRESLGVKNETTNFIFLSISGDNLYNKDVLDMYARVIDEINGYSEVTRALSPFNFVFFDTAGTRIIPTTITENGKAPKTESEIGLFERRIKSDPLANNFVVADDGRLLNTVFTTRYSADPTEFMARFKKSIEPLEKLVQVNYTGEIPIGSRISYYLSRDFNLLLALACLAMLTVFFLSFRSKRAVVLPVLVVGIGALWSIGFMSLVGFKLTIVSVIIPSLILTIGSSYTIHVLNEYFRSTAEAEIGKIQWLADAVEHVTRTVILAALTTVISFLSILSTTLKPLQEFGLSISLGIFFCALLALFFLPAVFNLMGPPQEKHRKRVNRGRLTRGVVWMGTWSVRHKYFSLVLFVLMMILYTLIYPSIKHQSDYFSYFPDDDRIIKDTRYIIKNTGGSQSFNITLTAPGNEAGYFLRPDVLKGVNALETKLAGQSGVNAVISFNTILKTMNKAVAGKYEIPQSRGLILLLNRYFRMIPTERFSLGGEGNLMNDDSTSITIYLKMSNPRTNSYLDEESLRNFVITTGELLHQNIEDGVKADLWGNTLLLLDASRTIKRDQFISTLLSILLGLIVTSLFFRSISYSLLALIPLLSGIFFYFITLYIFKIPLDMTTILVTNVTVGVGLDDAIHFILQYRTQRNTLQYREALKSTLRITGRPIVLTTMSLVAGLLVLCFASFSPIIFFGILIAGTLTSTMVGTVYFLPAAISLYEEGLAKFQSPQGRLNDS